MICYNFNVLRKVDDVMNDEYINDFLLYLEMDLNYSKNTIDTYSNALNHLNNEIKKDILKLNSNDIENFISKLNLESSSISNYLSAYKTFYNYYIKIGKISINPIDKVDSPKLSKHLPTYLTVEEVDKLLNIDIRDAFSARNKSLLELLYATGLRISELTNLEFKNIDLNECIVRIMGKGSKERIVPINDLAIKYLKIYVKDYRHKLVKTEQNNYVYLNNHGKKMTRQGIFKMIKKRTMETGIKKDVSPHTLRHSIATHMLENGADLRIIQEFLGHESIGTTQIYTHLTNKKLKNDYMEYFPRN